MAHRCQVWRDVRVIVHPLVLNKNSDPTSLNTCIVQNTHLLMCFNGCGGWGHIVGRWRLRLMGYAMAKVGAAWLKLLQCRSCSSSINRHLLTPHHISSNLTTSKYTENNTMWPGMVWFIANHSSLWHTLTCHTHARTLGGDESSTCAALHRAVHTLPLPHNPLTVLYEP